MGNIYLLAILLIVAVWYGIIPLTGAFISRYKWHLFRNRFNTLMLMPLLNYRQYRQIENDDDNNQGIFRFTGTFESITDGQTLWVRGEDLTMPVSLDKNKCFLLPKHEDEGVPNAPKQIRWNRISTLTEGTKVFIGGHVKTRNNRLNFCSVKEEPLMVIFYNCSDTELPTGIIRAARTRNEYWNNLTPISIVIGALTLLYIAASFLNRPAFRFTVITALVAVFVPILPVLPPGLLFTTLYRRLTWNARKFREDSDLARFGLLPDSGLDTARRYAIKAYSLELFGWLLMLIGVCVNIIFIYLILFLFQFISF